MITFFNPVIGNMFSQPKCLGMCTAVLVRSWLLSVFVHNAYYYDYICAA